MKKYQKQWLYLINSILSGVLLLLGFSSCANSNEENKEEILCMYGVPYVLYQIKGKVVDTESLQGIPNIQVEIVKEYRKVETDKNGEFLLDWQYEPFPREDQEEKSETFSITTTDIDGEMNGGLYKKCRQLADFSNIEKKESKIPWCEGEKRATMTIQMEKVKDTEK